MRSDLSPCRWQTLYTRASAMVCARITYGTWEDTWSSIAAGYISIPEGEGQFVPVIWRVHGDSLTVIQSLATLFLFPLPPSHRDLSLSPFAPYVRLCHHPSALATPLFGRHWVSCNLDRVTTTATNCARILLLQVWSQATRLSIWTITGIVLHGKIVFSYNY